MAPPCTVAPDERRPRRVPFSFDRLGVRVPAVIVSPWVGRGVIDSHVYDHTSIPAFVKKHFGLGDFLHERDRIANTFEHLWLPLPREDAPDAMGALVRSELRTARRVLRVEGARPPSELQSLLMLQAAAVQLPTTQREGAAYAEAEAARLSKSRPRRRRTPARRAARREARTPASGR
jgi:phospholipase C